MAKIKTENYSIISDIDYRSHRLVLMLYKSDDVINKRSDKTEIVKTRHIGGKYGNVALLRIRK